MKKPCRYSHRLSLSLINIQLFSYMYNERMFCLIIHSSLFLYYHLFSVPKLDWLYMLIDDLIMLIDCRFFLSLIPKENVYALYTIEITKTFFFTYTYHYSLGRQVSNCHDKEKVSRVK